MNWHLEENKAKLHILISLARMMESMADVAEVSRGGLSCEQLAGQMRAISAYQQQLTEKMTRIRIRKFRHGLLAKPWLHRSLRRTFLS